MIRRGSPPPKGENMKSFKEMTQEEKTAELVQTELMKDLDFCFTCKPYLTGNGYAFTLPHRWGFKDGDIILLQAVDRYGKKSKAYKRVCKQSTKNNSCIVFLDKYWDYDYTDYLTVTVNLIGRNCPPKMLRMIIYKLQTEGTFDESDLGTEEGVYLKKTD